MAVLRDCVLLYSCLYKVYGRTRADGTSTRDPLPDIYELYRLFSFPPSIPFCPQCFVCFLKTLSIPR